MESGTQLTDGGEDIVNDNFKKEEQIVASKVQEDDQTLSSEPKEDSSMGNGTASTEANVDQMLAMQNEVLPQQNGQALVGKTLPGVKGEAFGVASEIQGDNQTVPSEPQEESSVEKGNASMVVNIEQTPHMQNTELPQPNGQASVERSPIGVEAEAFGVASQIQEDNQTLSSELKGEPSSVDGNASTEANIEQMPRMQDVELLQQNNQARVYEIPAAVKAEAFGVGSERGINGAEHGAIPYMEDVVSAEPSQGIKPEPSSELSEKPIENAETETCLLPESKTNGDPGDSLIKISGPEQIAEATTLHTASSDLKAEKDDGVDLTNGVKTGLPTPNVNGTTSVQHSFNDAFDGNESGTEEEQSAFMKELESFFRDRSMEFKPPRFYRGELNCLKLWRSVIRLGGYDKVTSCKLWRQVGESFRPPKTCTTVSWTFRIFYEKALLEYERHKALTGELNIPVAAPSAPATPSALAVASRTEPMSVENQTPGSGRARRDAAARAMQGWHSQRLLGNGEVSDPIIKDKNSMSQQKREKRNKAPGLLKRKRPEYSDYTVSATSAKISKPHDCGLDIAVVDIGPPADWVKINVQKTKDCFEVYALVPGLLREEVRVQSDPAGRLVISGEPEHLDNPWGVTAFKKVVSLPGRIDPHQTSAVVTLHGQLFVRVPFAEPKTT